MDLAADLREARRNRLMLLALWVVFYCSFALFAPPLLDDADSVHAEVAREMLTRHDFVTLYANGIRYLEKAPLFYWMMALSMKVFGATTAASRLPLAFSVGALVLVLESFGRRAFASVRAGFYAGLITLSSFGIFIFTRINIPDALVCLLLTAALFCYLLTEAQEQPALGLCCGFAALLALNVLTKGLIGIVFPVGIVLVHLLLTRGWRGALGRLREFHPIASALTLLLIAVPWHVLIALANPGHGHPGDLSRIGGQWQVPLPTDGNVHGWAWFYFLNEQVYRYLNVRVPHDYDTAPLWLFLGLIAVWLMPWSAFLPQALARAWPSWKRTRARTLSPGEQTNLLLLVWAALPLLFFTFSTRQEYYVLPSLPPLILLVAQVLGVKESESRGLKPASRGSVSVEAEASTYLRRNDGAEVATYLRRKDGAEVATSSGTSTPAATQVRNKDEAEGVAAKVDGRFRVVSTLLLVGGAALSLATVVFLVHARTPTRDLAALLQQNPGDYALSFGHFLDLNAQALGLFRLPLALTAVALFFGPLVHYVLRRKGCPHAATLSLAVAAFLFLFAAHLGLRIFSPTLTSYQLAEAIRPQLRPGDMIAIHGEYEAGSTLGFYLRRNDVHIVEGRSSNLWYGSFFPDAPRIFETRESIAQKWLGARRIFLWQDPQDHDRPELPLSPVYVIANRGGHQILSNQPNR